MARLSGLLSDFADLFVCGCQVALMNTSMEQLKLVSEAKDYQEVVRGQMDLSRKLGEDLMSKTREAVELSQKTGEEVRGWCS
ncbi:MAG: hypothetical protein DBP01_18710 [gamma proteobacterium symbiont of Ctena orbiculata]|nr:MAG: hypothetical protein DBP01_18710 [gamma proteobacterium symbiont of Ctena orbiculata]